MSNQGLSESYPFPDPRISCYIILSLIDNTIHSLKAPFNIGRLRRVRRIQLNVRLIHHATGDLCRRGRRDLMRFLLRHDTPRKERRR